MRKFSWKRGLGAGAGLVLLAFPLSAIAGQTAASAAAPPPISSGHWTVTALGDGCTAALSINNADEIVGYSGDAGDAGFCGAPDFSPFNSPTPDSSTQATEWQLSGTTLVPTALQPAAGDTYALAFGINASGQVVGESYPSVQPVEFDPTGANPATPLVQLSGEDEGAALAVDDAGTAVGISSNGSGFPVGATYSLSGGPAGELNALPGYGGGSEPLAVSANGSAYAGASVTASGTTTEATEWVPSASGTSVVDLGDLPSSSGATNIGSFADGVNDAGTAVGVEADTFGSGSSATVDIQATEYSGGQVHGLGFLPSDDASQATAINNEGVAVGYSGNLDQSNPSTYPLADQQAVVFSGGTVINLNSYYPPSDGWNFQTANSINDDGQVVGEGTLNGVEEAYLATPPPIVTSVTPADGPAAGGTSVTISGTGLASAYAVYFGSNAATDVDVVSPFEITATAPAGTGTVDVRVGTTLGGGSAVSAADQFIYEPAPPPGTTSSASGVSTSPTGTATATEGGIGATAQGEGAVTVASYPDNPTGSSSTSPSGQWFDVDLSPGNTFTSVTIDDCSGGATNNLEWYNPAADSGAGAYEPVVGDPGPTYTPASGSSPACVTVTLTQSTSPTIADITGTVFAGEEPMKTTLTASPALLQLDGLKLYLLTLTATLTDSSGPIAGQTIVFTAGSTTICSAVTAANGTASCSGVDSILSIVFGLGYTATYAGSSVYGSSSGRGALIG